MKGSCSCLGAILTGGVGTCKPMLLGFLTGLASRSFRDTFCWDLDLHFPRDTHKKEFECLQVTRALLFPLESAPGCCDVLLIYASLGSKAKENVKSPPALLQPGLWNSMMWLSAYWPSWPPCANPHPNPVAPGLGNVLHEDFIFLVILFTFSVIVKMENYSINSSCINNNEGAMFERYFFPVEFTWIKSGLKIIYSLPLQTLFPPSALTSPPKPPMTM